MAFFFKSIDRSKHIDIIFNSSMTRSFQPFQSTNNHISLFYSLTKIALDFIVSTSGRPFLRQQQKKNCVYRKWSGAFECQYLKVIFMHHSDHFIIIFNIFPLRKPWQPQNWTECKQTNRQPFKKKINHNNTYWLGCTAFILGIINKLCVGWTDL